jgi:hypothetical protein
LEQVDGLAMRVPELISAQPGAAQPPETVVTLLHILAAYTALVDLPAETRPPVLSAAVGALVRYTAAAADARASGPARQAALQACLEAMSILSNAVGSPDVDLSPFGAGVRVACAAAVTVTGPREREQVLR